MNILITGALGHIGSYLLFNLPKKYKNLNIIAVDSLATNRYPSMFGLPNEAKYRFIEADVKSESILDELKISDLVIHLAATTDAESSVHNPEKVENNNFESTRKVTEQCIETSTKLIAISTSSIYGTSKKIVDENCDDQDLKPQSPYAKTKLREEKFLIELKDNDQFKNFSILRFGTIFGVSKGMRFHTAVNKFCWQAVMNKPLTVWKTALNQKRPYLDLVDALSAIETVINKNLFDGEIYNVLTKNLTVKDILSVIKLNIPNIEVLMTDSDIMNQYSYEVSVDKFIKKGFTPRGDEVKAIKETIQLLSNANSFNDK